VPFFPDVQRFAYTQDEAVDVSDKNNVDDEHF